MRAAWFHRLVLALLVVVIATMTTGCHTSNTRAPLTVAVRDKRTHEPVIGARVETRTVHFYIVWEAGGFPIVDLLAPKSARGVTGADGTVRLDTIAEHPVQIIVVAAGYDPQFVDLERHPLLWSDQDRIANADRWLDADPGPGLGDTPARVEVLVGP